ncbi:MAG: AAA family ATPase, partial [Alphaproteobacteria bacterium]|nr:AAA family ATPase [Alphaproteobacteria bacterium]
EFYGWEKSPDSVKFTVASAHEESRWDKVVPNGIDGHVKPILQQNMWRVYHFHDTSRTAKVKQEHNISNNKSLMFDAANLAAFLYRLKHNYTKSYNEIVETIRLIAPYFDDFVLEPQERNAEVIVLKWHQKGCEDIFNASQLSDGTLRFICLTTLLLQPDTLQPATIIVDEPELDLHPYAITMFAEMVKQVSAQKQVIISTQSVELLNEFDVEDVVVVNKDSNGATSFRRLDEESLKIWLDDYSLGDLWQKNILGGRLSK